MFPCINWLQPLLALLSLSFSSSTALLSASARGYNCPAGCQCPDHHTVDCVGQGLTSLPDPIPLNVRRLRLSDNWIPWIPSDFLVLYSDLVYLDLQNNSIQRLEPGTFSTSSRLVYLDLGGNNLTEIPSGIFGESRSLIKLRLGSNPHLSAVDQDAFMGLTSLRELELERDGLSELDSAVLDRLPSLRSVRLEGNPWVCSCPLAKLFAWLSENRRKLPTGLEGIECTLPADGRRVPFSMLSEDSFRECQFVLSLTDYLIVIFSGVAVLVVAIISSFCLACTVQCFQHFSKGHKTEEEEEEEGND